jgi:hypothetical protein
MAATIRRPSQNSNVYGAYGIVSSDNGRAVLAVGRNVLEIAYHLLGEQTTYRELGIDYFDRYRGERLKRRSLAQLQPWLPGHSYTSPNRRLRRIFQDRDR